MIVNNRTEISGEEATRLLVNASKNDYYKKFYFSIFLVLAGIPIMVYGLISSDYLYVTFGAVFIALSIVFTIFNVLSLRKIPKMVKEKNSNVCEHGVIYDYRFKEHSVMISASSNDKTTKYEYGYTALKKINEYPDKYELRFQGNVTIFVDKNDFKDKKMEEFFRHNISTSKKKIKLKK